MDNGNLSIISLKCPECGANLEIPGNLATFTCTYCGNQGRVTRSGVDASEKIAAELAIARLQAEYASLPEPDYCIAGARLPKESKDTSWVSSRLFPSFSRWDRSRPWRDCIF